MKSKSQQKLKLYSADSNYWFTKLFSFEHLTGTSILQVQLEKMGFLRFYLFLTPFIQSRVWLPLCRHDNILISRLHREDLLTDSWKDQPVVLQNNFYVLLINHWSIWLNQEDAFLQNFGSSFSKLPKFYENHISWTGSGKWVPMNFRGPGPHQCGVLPPGLHAPTCPPVW